MRVWGPLRGGLLPLVGGKENTSPIWWPVCPPTLPGFGNQGSLGLGEPMGKRGYNLPVLASAVELKSRLLGRLHNRFLRTFSLNPFPGPLNDGGGFQRN